MRRYRIVSEKWNKVVGQVQKIDGFGNFLQAVPFPILQEAAAEGPVIFINISNYHSDAIILHINSPPHLVTLPKVQPQDLIHLAEQLNLVRDMGAGTDHSKDISPILCVLWNDIASPVVDCLTEMGIPEKSRVWWCPTSELCALPLHAAGPYQPYQKNLPDIYISSYITTLSALIRARSNTFGQSVVPKLLVIGQPGEALRALPHVQAEIDDVQQLGEFVDVLVGPEANREEVLHGLQQHSWAHFACHGHLGDNTQPFHASFELHGGSSLTLLDLIQARLPNAELAFLSACHSAEGGLITPDETIHLAAALQFCGFRSVVGTLWAMDDEDGPMVSKEFYKHMFCKPGKRANFRDSAGALNLAIREMRKNRMPLECWTLFVHFGA
jgi:CHAT domain-containing protein